MNELPELKNDILNGIKNDQDKKNTKQSTFDVNDPIIVAIRQSLESFNRQKQVNEQTGDFRCIGGCGTVVSCAGGMCGVASGGIPACQH
jgi:hypothetical protein